MTLLQIQADPAQTHSLYAIAIHDPDGLLFTNFLVHTLHTISTGKSEQVEHQEAYHFRLFLLVGFTASLPSLQLRKKARAILSNYIRLMQAYKGTMEDLRVGMLPPGRVSIYLLNLPP